MTYTLPPMRDLRCRPAAICLTLAFLAGCAGGPQSAQPRQAPTPPITHVVLIQLKDPTRTQELILDCNRTLPAITSVLTYSCGTPMVSNRPNVVDDYSVGIYVGFQDEDGYRVYADDPGHLALVEKWRTAWKSIKIYDILDVASPATGDPPAVPAPQPQPAPAPAPAAAAPAAAAPAPAPATPPAGAPAAAPSAAPSTAAPTAPPKAPRPATRPATPPEPAPSTGR